MMRTQEKFSKIPVIQCIQSHFPITNFRKKLYSMPSIKVQISITK